MTRCCASFSNCCPEPAPVTITNNLYYVDELLFAPKVERLVYPTGFTAVTQCEIDGGTDAKWWVELAETPLANHSVQVLLEGTVDQRPLVGDGDGDGSGEPVAGEEYDYWVDGKILYLRFDLAAGDVIYVRYEHAVSVP